MRAIRSRAGYTLLEAMIVVAVIGIVASIGAKVMIQANRYFILTKARGDLQKQARAIMYIMTRELRQAQNSSIQLGQASASQPYYSSVTFTKEQGTQVTYYQNGNLLCAAENASAFTLTNAKGQRVCETTTAGAHITTLTSDLAYVAFSFPKSDDMTIISVSITLQTLINNGQEKALHMASEKVQVMD